MGSFFSRKRFSTLLSSSKAEDFPFSSNLNIKETVDNLENIKAPELLNLLKKSESLETLVVIEHPNKNVQYIAGTIEVDNTFKDHPILVLKSKKGTAFFSPNSKSHKFYDLSPIDKNIKNELTDTFDNVPRKAYSRSTVDDLRKAVCTDFKKATASPYYKQIAKQLNKYPKNLFFRRIRAINALQCLGAFPVGVGAIFLNLSLGQNRNQEGLTGYIGSHNSNFTLGIMAMGITHQCTKVIAPTRAKEILAMTLGGNLLLNAHYEVEMGLESSPLTDDIIRNDFHDLGSGVAAIALYATFVKFLEYNYAIRYSNLCK
ncbi:MAG: hypothetical protein ACJAT2_003435 [Bacteriovoracaceae bacterium]|jgi:hypothetical protein